MKVLRKTGKTVDEAVSEALKELDLDIDKVEVTVIDEGEKGILGFIGRKDATVEVKVKYDPEQAAKDFLHDVFVSMGIDVEMETSIKDKQLFIDLNGDDMGIVIGKRGQTLDSLQYLVNLVVNKESESYLSVILDTENYRKRRKETLETLAHNLAKKVKRTKKSIVLEPMNPYERRIIHSALQNDRYVSTHSEGEDPYRNVVITLK